MNIFGSVHQKKVKNYKLKFTFTFLAGLLVAGVANAAQPPLPPGTTAPYTVSYSARLTDSGGAPVTTTQSIRFSLWTDSDSDPTDYLGSGAIDPAAVGYAGWVETHTVTPDANGLFHVQLGDTVILPNFTDATHKFLEVDVKPVGSPDTSYEVLDPDGSTANLTDRHALNSAAFAINSDTVDNADVGTGPGNIVVLNGSSQFPISTIPGGTNNDTFVLDFDNTVSSPGSIKLQFGDTLAKFLEYDTLNTWFNFNDDVNITGNLTVTGTANFTASSEFHMREVPDKTLATCTTLHELVLDTTEGKIYTCTAVGSPGTWVTAAASTYDQSLVYEPEYADAVYQPDGTSNKGKLEIFYTDTDGSPGNNNINHYKWTTKQTTLQDNDLVIRVHVPEGFTAFQPTQINLIYKTDTASTADNQVDLSVEDTTGTAVGLTGASALTSTTFTTAAITFTGAPTFTAGDQFTVKVKLTAKDTGAAYAGMLSINYTGQ